MGVAKDSRQVRHSQKHHVEKDDVCPICGEKTKYIRGLYTTPLELEDLVKQGIFKPFKDGFLVDMDRLKQWRKEHRGSSK